MAVGQAPFGNPKRWLVPKDIWLRRTIALEKPLKMPALEILLFTGDNAEAYVEAGWRRPSLVDRELRFLKPLYPEAALR